MVETKLITSLYVVTDSETSYDNIGDIDGGLFPDGFLDKHIKTHGAGGLLEKLASMTSAVITAKYNIDVALNYKELGNPINNEEKSVVMSLHDLKNVRHSSL